MKKNLFLAVLAAAILLPAYANAGRESAPAAPAARPKLTYWMELNANYAQVMQEFGQSEYSKELQKATGVDIVYQHPAAGNSTEAFNIMMASGNYPDIIEYNWRNYPGGPDAAINDKVILQLDDVFGKYGPNITKVLKDHPDLAKMVSTDSGKYYVFPFLRGDSYMNNKLLFSEGWVFRKDLLDKAGLQIPVTPSELYNVLTALKTKAGVQTPMTLRAEHVSRVLSPGFDSHDGYFVENGKVRHGLIEKERKAYLEYTHKLYAEGLLDNDYFSVDRATQQSKVLNGIVAVTWAPGGSGIGTWLPAMQKSDPSVKLVSNVPMTPVRGRNAKFAKINSVYDGGSSAAITTSCKNVEAAAKLLDFNYSEAGALLVNFGSPGVTYNMVNGYPTYTDLILKNPEGLSINQAMSKYIRGHVHGPFIQDQRELEQYYTIPELTEALALWTKTDMGIYMLPPANPSGDESMEIARIQSNVNTYMNETEAKFITGALPISEFDNYVAQLKKFGIERAIAITQAAYDRYMKK